MTVDEAVAADRRYFDEHPGEVAYVREFVPGEIGAVELPKSPKDFAIHPCLGHSARRRRAGRALPELDGGLRG